MRKGFLKSEGAESRWDLCGKPAGQESRDSSGSMTISPERSGSGLCQGSGSCPTCPASGDPEPIGPVTQPPEPPTGNPPTWLTRISPDLIRFSSPFRIRPRRTFRVGGRRKENPTRSVRMPGVRRRAPPTRMAKPSRRAPPGSLPRPSSLRSFQTVLKPSSRARAAPAKPVRTTSPMVGQTPTRCPTWTRMYSSRRGTPTKRRKSRPSKDMEGNTQGGTRRVRRGLGYP